MSSFVVDPQVINRALMLLKMREEGVYLRRSMLAAGFPCESREELAALGAAMYALNVQATVWRYDGDDEPPGTYDDEGVLVPYRYALADGGRYSYLKALNCWHYQCLEGDVPKDPLFRAWEEVAHQVAASIVQDLPQYEAARWG